MLADLLADLVGATDPPELQGPPEEIGTGLYRMVDGEILGHEPTQGDMGHA